MKFEGWQLQSDVAANHSPQHGGVECCFTSQYDRETHSSPKSYLGSCFARNRKVRVKGLWAMGVQLPSFSRWRFILQKTDSFDIDMYITLSYYVMSKGYFCFVLSNCRIKKIKIICDCIKFMSVREVEDLCVHLL